MGVSIIQGKGCVMPIDTSSVVWSPSEVDYHRVKADPTARIAYSCTIAGNVILGKNVSVMSGCHLISDGERIEIGDDCNVQEGTIMHIDPGLPIVIGKHTSIGHRAMLHGCRIGENCMIGMCATVMNGAKIGNNCVVAAGALVTEGKEFPDNSLIVGVPAKVKRELSEQEIFEMCTYPASDYVILTEAMVKDGLMFHPDPDFNFKAC